jgi:hypothetical protein
MPRGEHAHAQPRCPACGAFQHPGPCVRPGPKPRQLDLDALEARLQAAAPPEQAPLLGFYDFRLTAEHGTSLLPEVGTLLQVLKDDHETKSYWCAPVGRIRPANSAAGPTPPDLITRDQAKRLLGLTEGSWKQYRSRYKLKSYGHSGSKAFYSLSELLPARQY